MVEKSFLKNSIYNVLYKLLNAVFPLISATYVSHVILASGVGKVSSAQNIAQYFVLIAALGIPLYGTREISINKKNHEEMNKVFTELFVINAVSTTICCFLYYYIIHSFTAFSNELNLYNVAGLMIVLNYINVDWFYQGIEEYGYMAKRSLLIKLCSLLLLFLCVRTPNDYIIYALIHVLATAGNYIFNIINLKKYNVKIARNNVEINKHLKPILILLCTSIAIELYTLLDTTMLTFFCPSENVGYYTNSVKIVKMVITVVTAIGGVLLPRLSYYKKEGKIQECTEIVNKVLSILVYLFLPCGIGILLTADSLVVVLFGNTFIPAITTLRIAALLIYALGFSNVFGTQVLLTFNGEKQLFLCTLIGAVTNIAMNAILIPRFQQNGAMVSSVISETCVTIIAFLFSKKFIQYHVELLDVLKSLLSCFIMCISIYTLHLILKTGLMSLVLSVLLGVLIYSCCNYIFKNSIVFDLIGIIKAKK